MADETQKNEVASRRVFFLKVAGAALFGAFFGKRASAQDMTGGSADVKILVVIEQWWEKAQKQAEKYNKHIDSVNKTMKTFDDTHKLINFMKDIDGFAQRQREQFNAIFDNRLKNGEHWTKFRVKNININGFVAVRACKKFFKESVNIWNRYKKHLGASGKDGDAGAGVVIKQSRDAQMEYLQSQLFVDAISEEIKELEKTVKANGELDAKSKVEMMNLELAPINTQIQLRQLKLQAYAVKQNAALLEMWGLKKPIDTNDKILTEDDFKTASKKARDGDFDWRPA